MSTEKSETPRMTAACRDARGIDEGCKLELELAAANERLVTMRKAFETSSTEQENKLQDQLAAANLAREQAEQHSKLLDDQLRRTQGYEADMAGKLERTEKNVAMWMCGCGWINGVNLAVCANCSRTIMEGHGILIDVVLTQAQASSAEIGSENPAEPGEK